MPPITNDWLLPLKAEFSKPYYARLYKKVMEEYRTRLIFPAPDKKKKKKTNNTKSKKKEKI